MAESDSSTDRFSTFLAFCIAVVSIVGALVAWRVAVALSDAGSADTRGLLAAVAREDVTTQATLTLYGHLTAYASFVQHDALSDAFAALANAVSARRTEFSNLSSVHALASNRALFFVPQNYLDREKRLDRQRDLGENIAQDSLNKDINPQPYFLAADTARLKAQWLLLNLVLLGGALVWLTLADALQNPLRYLVLLLGLGFFGLGTLLALIVEWFGPPLISIAIQL